MLSDLSLSLSRPTSLSLYFSLPCPVEEGRDGAGFDGHLVSSQGQPTTPCVDSEATAPQEESVLPLPEVIACISRGTKASLLSKELLQRAMGPATQGMVPSQPASEQGISTSSRVSFLHELLSFPYLHKPKTGPSQRGVKIPNLPFYLADVLPCAAGCQRNRREGIQARLGLL